MRQLIVVFKPHRGMTDDEVRQWFDSWLDHHKLIALSIKDCGRTVEAWVI